MDTVSGSSDRELTSMSVYNEDRQMHVLIQLEGLKKKDFYATNLHLTGSTNWYIQGVWDFIRFDMYLLSRMK